MTEHPQQQRHNARTARGTGARKNAPTEHPRRGAPVLGSVRTLPPGKIATPCRTGPAAAINLSARSITPSIQLFVFNFRDQRLCAHPSPYLPRTQRIHLALTIYFFLRLQLAATARCVTHDSTGETFACFRQCPLPGRKAIRRLVCCLRYKQFERVLGRYRDVRMTEFLRKKNNKSKDSMTTAITLSRTVGRLDIIDRRL